MATVKWHDLNGKLYMVVFNSNSVRISSYSYDAIRTGVEIWADGVPALT